MNVSGSSMNMNSRGSSRNNDSMIKSGLGMGSTRDSRAQEAIRMKDEQLRILTDQNSHLLKSLDQVEEEANTMPSTFDSDTKKLLYPKKSNRDLLVILVKVA